MPSTVATFCSMRQGVTLPDAVAVRWPWRRRRSASAHVPLTVRTCTPAWSRRQLLFPHVGISVSARRLHNAVPHPRSYTDWLGLIKIVFSFRLLYLFPWQIILSFVFPSSHWALQIISFTTNVLILTPPCRNCSIAHVSTQCCTSFQIWLLCLCEHTYDYP